MDLRDEIGGLPPVWRTVILIWAGVLTLAGQGLRVFLAAYIAALAIQLAGGLCLN